MAPKIVRVFTGLVISIAFCISVLIALCVITVCLNAKLESLRIKYELDSEADQLHPQEDERSNIIIRDSSRALDDPESSEDKREQIDNLGIDENL